MISLLVTGSILTSLTGYAYYFLNYGRLKNAQKFSIEEDSEVPRIRRIFQKALDEMPIRNKDKIQLFIIDKGSGETTFGNFLSKDLGVIVSVDGLMRETDDTVAFIFKHEIAHLQKNHLLKIPCVCFFAGVIPLLVYFIYPLPPIIHITVSSYSTIVVIFFYVRSTESEAHAIAAQFASEKEIQDFINCLVTARESNVRQRNSYLRSKNWRYHLFTEDGTDIIDFLHPALSDVIRNLTKILSERKNH